MVLLKVEPEQLKRKHLTCKDGELMKKILITGEDSYIGTSLEKWLSKNPEEYRIDTIDMRVNKWRDKDFSEYDVVFHVAGIVHVKETKKNKDIYYVVNRDLAYETAEKAKVNGVKQFVFLSSMSVYGVIIGTVTKETKPNPQNAYSKSKLQAEVKLRELVNGKFKVVILRPPMVYGPMCKGNYQVLRKIALNMVLFPKVNNKRSMIYIDNLCEFIKRLIDDEKSGLFTPQNSEYVNTSEMIKLISEAHGKKMRFTKVFNLVLKLVPGKKVDKAFGSLVYKDNEDLIDFINFEDSVTNCEK